jgi:2-keto-4-pentenoate hydratase/2-oxohepta-3-ene-1,7-dioic acid hydratase in catechol pathway
MIRGIAQMISEMSDWFSLQPGDIILTGTPAGVGPLITGDQLQLTLDNHFSVQSQVSHTPALAVRSGV